MFKSVKTGLLAAVLVASAVVANAQKKLTQGTATYTAETPQGSMDQKFKFNGNIFRLDMEQGPATIGILQDYVAKTGLMLIDVPVAQKQFAVKMSKQEIEQAEAASPKLSDFKATGEKQKIGNYNAEKYTYKDDKGETYELWATTEVELPAGFFGSQFKDIKGTLVKYTTFQNGMKVNLTLKGVSEDKVGPFSLEVPSGYEVVTMQQLMSMMQGGGQ